MPMRAVVLTWMDAVGWRSAVLAEERPSVANRHVRRVQPCVVRRWQPELLAGQHGPDDLAPFGQEHTPGGRLTGTPRADPRPATGLDITHRVGPRADEAPGRGTGPPPRAGQRTR